MAATRAPRWCYKRAILELHGCLEGATREQYMSYTGAKAVLSKSYTAVIRAPIWWDKKAIWALYGLQNGAISESYGSNKRATRQLYGRQDCVISRL